MHQVIPVWVINLTKRPDRLFIIGNRLDELGIAWKRLEAIDGNICDETELSISKKSGEIGAISNAARACTASHYKFWKEFMFFDAKYGIVLEDDVEISDDFKKLVFDLSWIPNHAKLIKLEKSAAHKKSTLLLGFKLSETKDGSREVRKMHSRHCGTAAYLISKKGAKVAINWNQPFSVPIDHVLFNETVSKLCTALQTMILIPPISWQSHNIGKGSDIINDKVLLTTGRKPLIRSIKRAYYETRLLPYQLFLYITNKAEIITFFRK